MSCQILGKSGKIRLIYIGNNTKGNFSDDKYTKNQLTFEVDEIAEVDAQGSEVGKTGAKKHSVKSLANQEFTFTKVDNVSYYQGVKVINVNLTAYLDGPNATLYVMVYLFLENGNVTFGNESFAVFKGTLKFNIKVCLRPFFHPSEIISETANCNTFIKRFAQMYNKIFSNSFNDRCNFQGLII